MIDPTSFDLWCATKIAEKVPQHPFLNLIVQSGIGHGVLGGLWFAAALFTLWVNATASSQHAKQRRLITTLVASFLAPLLALFLSYVVQWTPPYHHPKLVQFYADYFNYNPNFNSFPSQSTAVYSAIAAGLCSRWPLIGSVLWFCVIVLIALPRMYDGGHYLTDVVVGFIIGLIAYELARMWEKSLSGWLQSFTLANSPFARLANLVVFVWLLELAVEFREVTWTRNVLGYLWK